MSKVLVSVDKLNALVDAYNGVVSGEGKYTLDDLAEAISNIQMGDPGEDLKTVLEDNYKDGETFTGYDIANSARSIRSRVFNQSKIGTGSFPNAITVNDYAFNVCEHLKNVSLPVATEIKASAFYNCIGLQSVYAPLAQTIGSMAFYYCTVLPEIDLPSVSSIGGSCFRGCVVLRKINIGGDVGTIPANCFGNCSAITALLLPNVTKVTTLQNANALTGTPIASGTGYIYVPDALVDSFKAATNWSTYAAQIKPISEYVEE